MFTGLIESVGVVRELIPRGPQARLVLELPFADELTLGESVAVNGCCLTVAEFDNASACFDLLTQTLQITALNRLKSGYLVSLERAMKLGDRLGGHLVQGHVDAVGDLLKIDESGQDHILQVRLPDEIVRLCVPKGSLAVDGISLTIAELDDTLATFWITPHTWQHTHLPDLRPGQQVNIEADMLAKHVERLLKHYPQNSSR
ncbi:MAG: riboflavin synthase [Luteolibacter sp.]